MIDFSSLTGTRLQQEIEQAARSDAKILITGEDPALSRLVAYMIHLHSRRRDGQFLALDCSKDRDTLEAEMFGYVPGVLDGAVRGKAGLAELAHGGTLFLDGVNETPLRMQGLILKFLEDGFVQPLGVAEPDCQVDVRILSSVPSFERLTEQVRAQTFREDLYYRLNVVRLHVPAEIAVS